VLQVKTILTIHIINFNLIVLALHRAIFSKNANLQ